jgi:hypothetical protein
MWSMTEIQSATEYAEVTAVSNMSAYSLENHSHPRIILIKKEYPTLIDGEPMLFFDCVCCSLWYTVAKKDIWYKSLGEIEPDLVTPT